MESSRQHPGGRAIHLQQNLHHKISFFFSGRRRLKTVSPMPHLVFVKSNTFTLQYLCDTRGRSPTKSREEDEALDHSWHAGEGIGHALQAG
jgi:hypothetical protein